MQEDPPVGRAQWRGMQVLEEDPPIALVGAKRKCGRGQVISGNPPVAFGGGEWRGWGSLLLHRPCIAVVRVATGWPMAWSVLRLLAP